MTQPELSIATSSSWVNSLISDQIKPFAALPYLVKLAQKELPHRDWDQLAVIEVTSEVERFGQWLGDLIFDEPPTPNIQAFWFGLFNPVKSNGRICLQLYVSGANSPNVEDSGTGAYWVEGRYFDSAVLDAIYKTAYGSKDGLGNSAEYLLGLGYTAALVLHTAELLGAGLLSSDMKDRVIAFGFDSGDVIKLGQVTKDGFQPAHQRNVH